MPNSVKYNTESEANALTIGNMHIGTGDIPKGPTSSTGFYNGINPPNGGYAIYIHKTTEGSSILLPTNDAELIVMTNQIAGASYTTINECFNYFAGQSGKFVIHNPIPPFITSDLRFSIDSRILPSYPRNGSTLYDLSGYNNNWTPLTNVVFNGQSFEFNGTTSYMQDTVSSFNPDSAPNVMEVLFKPMDLGSRQQAIFSDNWGPEYGVWINSNNTLQGVAYTSVSTSNIQVGRWYYAILNVQPGATRSSTDQTYIQFYVNGQFIGTNNANTGNGMNDQPFSLGFDYKSNNPAAFFSGSIASARLSYGQYDQADVNFNYYGGNIVTDGLVTALDFSNLVSYESGSSSGYSLTGSVGFDLFNSPTDTSNFGGGIKCQETDEFIALDDVTATDYVTVEVWYTRDSAGSGEDIVFNKESTWEIRDDGGNINWAVKANNQGWFWYDSTANISVGETVHFVLTYDGNYVKSYKNGELVQTYTYPSGGVLTSQTSCYPKLNSRGCTRTSVSNPGNHTFYQFRIYDRALTDEEVAQNYNANINRFN